MRVELWFNNVKLVSYDFIMLIILGNILVFWESRTENPTVLQVTTRCKGGGVENLAAGFLVFLVHRTTFTPPWLNCSFNLRI